MANVIPSTLSEGQSATRPPFFEGTNYPYWKERMRIFIQSTDYSLWKIIVNGPEVPMTTNEKGVRVPKTEDQWNSEDLKKIELNAKAVNMMHCAISFEEYKKISECNTAKEMWDKLQLTHEGTKQVRRAISFEEYKKISECNTAKEMWDKLQLIRKGTKQRDISCTSTMAEILGTPIDEMFAQLLEQTHEGDDQISSPKVKIQKVPAFLRQNPDFAKYCSPKIVSFGPIHYRNEDLKLGKHYKIQWACRYIEEFDKQAEIDDKEAAAKRLHGIIKDHIEELRNLFTKDVIESYDNDELAWMLFVDGCSLLYYMDNVDDQHPEALKLKLDQLMYTWRDIILLENQLPMRVLELLSQKTRPDVLEHLLYNFIFMGLAKRNPASVIAPNGRQPTHILDYIRSFYTFTFGDESNEMAFPPPKTESWQTYKNIRDLKKAGIQVMARKKDEWKWSNISFTSRWFSGELRLPVITVNDVTPYFYQNLIAYEMCPDFPNNFEFCSYFSFMDSLIDTAEDVTELRLAGVLQNLLGSDKEVAKLFNELGHELPAKMFNYMTRNNVVAYSKEYIQVKHQIEKHYRNKWKTWLVEARNTYFNTPWSLIAFLAALLALVLTLIQTVYTIHPK